MSTCRRRWVACCVASILAYAHAIHVNVDAALRPSAPQVLLEDFSCDRGAEIRIDVQQAPPRTRPFTAYVMYSADWATVKSRIEDRMPVGGMCMLPSAAMYQAVANLSAVFRAPLATRYSVALVQCQTGPVQLTGVVSATNPGRPSLPHLSLVEYDARQASAGMAAVYMLFFALVAGLTYGRKDKLRVTQSVGCLALLGKSAEHYSAELYNDYLGIRGVKSDALATASRGLDSLSAGLFLLMVMLLALGWQVTRRALLRREALVLRGVFALYAALALLSARCNDPSQSCGAFLLAEYSLRSLLMLAIIVALNFGVAHLRGALAHVGWTASTHRFYVALAIYQPLRRLFFLYLVTPTLVLIVRMAVLSWRGAWLAEWITETVNMLLYAAFFWSMYPSEAAQLRKLQHALSHPAHASAAQAAGRPQQQPEGARAVPATAPQPGGADLRAQLARSDAPGVGTHALIPSASPRGDSAAAGLAGSLAAALPSGAWIDEPAWEDHRAITLNAAEAATLQMTAPQGDGGRAAQSQARRAPAVVDVGLLSPAGEGMPRGGRSAAAGRRPAVHAREVAALVGAVPRSSSGK